MKNNKKLKLKLLFPENYGQMEFPVHSIYYDPTLLRKESEFKITIFGPRGKPMHFRPFELLLTPFWFKVNDGLKQDCLFEESSSDSIIKRLRERTPLQELPDLNIITEDSFLTHHIERVWDVCSEGTYPIHISKKEFCLWFNRLYCVVIDLLGNSFINDFRPNRIRNIIKVIALEKHRQEWESFERTRWADLLPKKDKTQINVTKNILTKHRIQDIRFILNLFNNSIQLEDALTKFLHSLYNSFGDELVRLKYFGRCQNQECQDYFIYCPSNPIKKHCTAIREGKNCGPSARFKNWYSNPDNQKKVKNNVKKRRASIKAKT